MLLINKSPRPHIIDIPNQAFPMTIYPGMVFEQLNGMIYNKEDIVPFDIQDIKKYKVLSVVRRFALGDILQLIPVMRYLKKKHNFKQVYIFTNPDYCSYLKWIYPDIKFFPESFELPPAEDRGITVCLDGILEKDHNPDNPQIKQHRVQIYLDFFGEYNIPVTDIDFEGKLNMEVVKHISHENMIGIQLRGSGEIKTLPKEFVKRMAFILAEKYKVVLLDHDVNQGFGGKNIVNLCGKLNVYECVALLTKLKVCLTMDSGMLWLAHSAKCPVITFLGPTREAERLTLHPLYPEKAKAICLNELVNCQPCFETKHQCKGRISCMKDFNHDILLDKIQKTLKSMGV